MKKSLLYIGNKLSGHNATVTSIETLGLLLEKEGYEVFYASSMKNKMHSSTHAHCLATFLETIVEVKSFFIFAWCHHVVNFLHHHMVQFYHFFL